jgi:hypothetical protein
MDVKNMPDFITPPASLHAEYLFDFHLAKNPHYPVFVHSTNNNGLRYYAYTEVTPAVHRAGRLVSRAMDLELDWKSWRPATAAIFGEIGEYFRQMDWPYYSHHALLQTI